MKKLSITALLIVSLFAAAPAIYAADWSNGEFSCDLKVTKLAAWWNVFNWGKWEELQVKYSLISRPESSVTFKCYAGSFYLAFGVMAVDYNQFNCGVDQASSSDCKTLTWRMDNIQYRFTPGTNASQACDAIFNGHSIRKK